MAERSFFDSDLPSITWYTATLVTPDLRAISAPEMPLLSISIFIRVANLIMIIYTFAERTCQDKNTLCEYL